MDTLLERQAHRRDWRELVARGAALEHHVRKRFLTDTTPHSHCGRSGQQLPVAHQQGLPALTSPDNERRSSVVSLKIKYTILLATTIFRVFVYQPEDSLPRADWDPLQSVPAGQVASAKHGSRLQRREGGSYASRKLGNKQRTGHR